MSPPPDVTREGLVGEEPDREAMVGVNAGDTLRLEHKKEVPQGQRAGRRRSLEQPMVPRAEFSSYYGKPVINQPIWSAPDIAGYLFAGGLAGASSVLGFGAQVTGRPTLARASKIGAAISIGVGLTGLVHDLGKPSRFYNMMRVFKVTSPMSVGSWLLAAYSPAAFTAAASAATGAMPGIGAVASAGAAALGPAISSYTAALICDTAVPSWHDGFREMPFVFVGSSAIAAGGLGLLTAPVRETEPARRLVLAGAALDLGASRLLVRRIGPLIATPYHDGKTGQKMRLAQALTLACSVGAWVFGRRNRVVSALCGAGLLAASALTRFAIFEAGIASANDPAHTIVPQRERLDRALGQGASPADTAS